LKVIKEFDLQHISKKLQYLVLIVITCFCTSCATSVGLAASAVTSATIAVGKTIVTAPFKMMGAMDDDDEDGDEYEDNNIN
tara:strand:- start:11 stop:253 length:243 start_codon:yes stop_codon:yes gene_type:complete